MSADTVAAPRLSLNVRYNRNVQENSGEEEESQVEILEDEEHHADLRPQRARPHTQNNPAANNRRCFKATAVALGGFYLLMLAGLFIRFTLLQTRYDQLSNNNSQLQDEVKKLKDRTEVFKSCPHGWTGFGHSWYFKSEEKKNWYDSRADCQQRGADLVVINNKEEQEFVSELSKDGESWIGLWYEWTQGGWKWEWVDGSLLTEKFWAAGLPHYNGYYAACCIQQGKWTQGYYSDNKNWICEKMII
ncbi:CD209 antigen-like protein E isoform X3 [Perca fluviatilis]|uniref:CD209 antigen-like protein E isoform X3 n=1 Tax=Perca fluviatilis TaxID=8168 RepID=UPI001964CC7C|nr:CD209 antigen-like protein E isoform X3 [Perca fluviatilis]